MRYLLLLLILVGCKQEKSDDVVIDDQPQKVDSILKTITGHESPEPKTYSNERFKDVKVDKSADGKYIVSGTAQIFEASFSWIVEDGHNEIKKGYEMTDAGAPEWGNFSFEFFVEKERPNSTLMLILFESSAKDGSRQHELPIALTD